MGDNYEELCNQGVPCKAEQGLMSQCVTPVLQGFIANQPPRRGMRSKIIQTLHHHAGGKAITSPFPCAVIFTTHTHTPFLTLKSTWHSWLGRHWIESKVPRGCNQMCGMRKGRKKFGVLHPDYSNHSISLKHHGWIRNMSGKELNEAPFLFNQRLGLQIEM